MAFPTTKLTLSKDLVLGLVEEKGKITLMSCGDLTEQKV
jgi:hypothetical protein